jgi:hypothetical protein
MVYNTADNNYGVAKWIVDPTAGNGTHTTIATALTSASSGDTIFIRPGTYTENLTLKAGVCLTAFECNGYQPSVIIFGKATATFVGTCTISGIQLVTNADNFLAVTGSSATIVKLKECLLTVSSNSVNGILYSSSSASSVIELDHCQGDVSGTTSAMFSSTSTGTLKILYCNITNSIAGTTASTTSATLLTIAHSNLLAPISVTSPVALSEISYTTIDCSAINATALTTVTSLTLIAQSCTFRSGSASAVSVGASSTLSMINCSVSSTNTNAVTGAGTLNQNPIAFSNTSSLINTTTIGNFAFGRTGTWTPVVSFGGSSAGVTYSGTPTGYYTLIGKLCYIKLEVSLTNNGSGTGTCAITLPFTSSADSGTTRISCAVFNSATSLPAGSTYCLLSIGTSTNSSTIDGFAISGSTGACTEANITNSAIIAFCGSYHIT